jgi:2-polyprenyl-3-methyl-5-hydroxy-6-metoxy-1,4-benzoquinol methylase
MKCLICNSKNIQKSKNIVRCLSCGHQYKEIQEAKNIEFQSKYHLRSRCRTLTLVNNQVPKTFHNERYGICKSRVNKIKGILKEEYTLLDVGGSCGTFGVHIKPYVKEIEITDLANYQKKESERLGFKFYQGNFLTLNIDKKYDIVTAWHVLEHINDVNKFIEKCKSLSKKYIVIEVPTERKIQQNIESDGHIHYFTSSSFKVLLDKFFKTYTLQKGVQKPALLAIIKKGI